MMKYFSIWISMKEDSLNDRIIGYIANKFEVLDDFVLVCDEDSYTVLADKFPDVPREQFIILNDMLDSIDLDQRIKDEISKLNDPSKLKLVSMINRVDMLKIAVTDYTDRAYIDMDIIANDRANYPEFPEMDKIIFATHGTRKMMHMRKSEPLVRRIDAHYLYNGSSLKISEVLADFLVDRFKEGLRWSKFGVELFSCEEFLRSPLVTEMRALNSYVVSPVAWETMADVVKGISVINIDDIQNITDMTIGVHMFNGSQHLNKLEHGSDEMEEKEQAKVWNPEEISVSDKFIPIKVAENVRGVGRTTYPITLVSDL